jgi:hypothetical protein
METHVKVLAVLQIVLGALGVLIGLGVFAIMGGVAGIVQMDGGNDAEMVVPLLGVGAYSDARAVHPKPGEYPFRHHDRRLWFVGSSQA